MSLQQLRELAKQVDPTVEIDDDVASVCARARAPDRLSIRHALPAKAR